MTPFLVTDTGVIIYHGSVVVLSKYPNVKWLIRCGWYTYQNNQYNGWFCSSIPANDIIPINESELSGVILVSTPCCPAPPSPSPYPVPDEPSTSEIRNQLERAWITVDTIEQRDRLNMRIVPDGKVVKVNDVEGLVKYYSYDQSLSTWVEEMFGLDGSFVTKDELQKEMLTLMDENEEVHETIQNIARKSINWIETQEQE